MTDLIEVCRPATLAEAVVVQSILEAYGIVGYVANENLCRIVPFARELPAFAMRVLVDAACVEEARALLEPLSGPEPKAS